jgi:DNA polymerase I
MGALTQFKQIWCVDFEFTQPDGERPEPICMVAHDCRGDQTVRLWEDDLHGRKTAPYACGRDSLFVAYYASAEFQCHLALGWSLPRFVLDLYVEFRNLTNGLSTPFGKGLLGALMSFGESGIGFEEKAGMRKLAMRGRPWTGDEQAALLAYCESDVRALTQLLSRMEDKLDWPRALLRGRYTKAAARMEFHGVPIAAGKLSVLRSNWTTIQHKLVQRVDRQYGVFDGLTFKADRWAKWVVSQGIAWPILPSGNLALDQNTFRDMAKAYPQVNPIRELRASLSQFRLEQLAVGSDGRNRTMLSMFGARTGRNAPSNTQCIFGPAVWLRNLIRPEPGCGLAYIDWSQQEVGIGAALSGDTALSEAYLSDDPYLRFGQQAGLLPPHATKATHGALREQLKACVLATQYGMGPESLAYRIGQTPAHAKALLRLHRETYRRFWQWSDICTDFALLNGRIWTVFGWTLHVPQQPNLRSLRNFPMQANGAEMLRLACCLATERDVSVGIPVHDAVLIQAPLSELDHHVWIAQESMKEASRIVLNGFELRSEAKLIRYPQHYQDPRGEMMWSTVWSIVDAQADKQA